jgi:hypothetical protein
MAKQDDYVRYTIRVPADLYGKLQEAAGEKSINAEIITRLEASFDKFLPEGLHDEGREIVRQLREEREAIERVMATKVPIFEKMMADLEGLQKEIIEKLPEERAPKPKRAGIPLNVQRKLQLGDDKE